MPTMIPNFAIFLVLFPNPKTIRGLRSPNLRLPIPGLTCHKSRQRQCAVYDSGVVNFMYSQNSCSHMYIRYVHAHMPWPCSCTLGCLNCSDQLGMVWKTIAGGPMSSWPELSSGSLQPPRLTARILRGVLSLKSTFCGVNFVTSSNIATYRSCRVRISAAYDSLEDFGHAAALLL